MNQFHRLFLHTLCGSTKNLDFFHKKNNAVGALGVSMLTVLLVLLLGEIHAQQTFCHTHGGRAPVDPTTVGSRSNPPGPYHFKVYFHVVQKEDGTGGQTPSDVQYIFNVLNGDFNPHNIFFAPNYSIQYIKDNSLYYTGSLCDFSSFTHCDGIDIFLMSDDAIAQGGKANNIPSDYFFISGSYWEDPFGSIPKSRVVSHEMGHCLGLWHTFHGSEPPGPFSDCDGGALHDPNVCLEFVDGSNGLQCGDYVDDTPADPNMNFDVSGCQWQGSGLDPNEDPYNPDEHNIMAYTHPDCMAYFTQGQGAFMRNTIETSPILQACLVQADPITHIYENTLFNTPQNMSGDIYVHSGAELLIESKISMPQGAHIIVERNARLVVDNGGIITRRCDTDWGGIQVLGNNKKAQPERFAPLTDPEQAGIVWIDNATIEWARCGVTAGGGYGPEFWGGLVWTNKATFRNNLKGIEFMSYKFTPNKSKFFYTTFVEEGDAFEDTEGVTIWETDGVEFDHCTFSNLDFEGIGTYDASIKVWNANNFNGNETGITSFATYPMASKTLVGSSTTAKNLFLNNKYHIHASLATNLFGEYSDGKFSLDVINNDFNNGGYGVIVDGASNFRVAGNLFTGVPFGVWVANTGFNNQFNQNLITCNHFDGGSNLGIIAIGENKELQFLSNDFDLGASGRDFVLTNSIFPFLNGSIAAMQGNSFVPASNCFTSPGAQVDILTWGSTDPFIYRYAGKSDSYCQQEPLTIGNYTKLGNGPTPSTEDCSGYGGLPRGMGEPNPRDLETRRKELQLLAQGATGGDANAAAKYYQLLQEKEAILKYLLVQSLEKEDFETAEELLKGEGSVAADWAILGLRIDRKAYDEAAAWLNKLPVRNETELEFKAVQQINLERLQKTESFQLSVDQEAYLASVAESGSPVRGYARSILGLLKNRRFYPETYEIGDGKKEVQERSAMGAPNVGLKIFPSPVSDNLTVAWPSLFQGATVEMQVIDMLGKVRMQVAVGNGVSQHNLEVTPLDNGVYNLILVENGKAVQRTKFVVQK